MKLVALIAAVALSGAANAQVFKCTEGGKTVFSDVPCGKTAREIDTTPARGAYDHDAAMRIRQQTEGLNRRFDAEDRKRQIARESAAREAEAEKKAKEDRCNELRRDRDRNERLAKTYRYKDNIKRAEQQAESAEDALWWECKKVW